MRKSVIKILTPILLFLMTVCFVLSGTAYTVGTNAEKGVENKKKNVVILFDNSTSMDNYDKISYAKFSLQLLISLFSENDTLSIVPMNVRTSNSQYAYKSIYDAPNKNKILEEMVVDLTKDRQTEIANIMQKGGNYGAYLDTCGSTPSSSLDVCMEQLEKAGIKKLDNLNEAPDEEFWFIVLTDGEFEGLDKQGTAKRITALTAPYAGIHTIYWGLGKDAHDLSDVSGFVKSNVSAYKVDNQENMAQSAQKIANQISSRYPLDNSAVTVNGKTATLDLDSCGFAVRSISLLLQNNLGNLVSAKYNGQNCTVTRNCFVSQKTENGTILSSLTANILNSASNYFNGGELVFEFSSEVNKDNLAFLIEPALYIEPVFSCSKDGGNTWEEGDNQYINANLKPNDLIKVDYVIHESVYGRVVDPDKLAGKKTASVSYDGTAYSIGESISLKKGKKEVSVSVSVMDGIYTMYSTVMCITQENPTYYRVESNIKTNTSTQYTAEYSVFDNNVLLNESSFGQGGYSCKLFLTDKNGNEKELSLDYNGTKIISEITLTKKEYGTYGLEFTVTSPDSMTRTLKDKISYFPSSVEIVPEKSEMTVTQHQLESNTDRFGFSLKSDGETIPFERGLYEYSLKAGNLDLTDFAVLDDDGTLKFMPTSENVKSINSIGKKDIKLVVTCPEYPSLKAECTVALNITDTMYVIQCINTEDVVIDRYNINASDSKIYFSVTRDGEYYSLEELQQEFDNGNLKVDTSPFGWITILPANIETFITEYEGNAVLCCQISSDCFSPLDNLFGAFIFPNEKDVTATMYGASATETVFISPVSFTSRVIRWVILIVIIYIIVHLLLWVIGFFVAQKLPKGYIVEIGLNARRPDSTRKMYASTTGVNIDRKEVVKWHLKRLIPFCVFKDQKFNTKKCQYFNIVVTKSSTSGYGVLKDRLGKVSLMMGLPNAKIFQNYIRALTEGKDQDFEMKQNDLRKIFRYDMSKIKDVGAQIALNGNYYAYYNEKFKTAEELIFFVKCHKKYKNKK